MMTLLFALLPQAAAASGTGLEWMVIASFVVPALLLVLIFIAGRKLY